MLQIPLPLKIFSPHTENKMCPDEGNFVQRIRKDSVADPSAAGESYPVPKRRWWWGIVFMDSKQVG
jgi:hypothetical protein